MKIGYARCSTKEKNLDLQLDALEKAGVERVFTEKKSGAKKDFPVLDCCLDFLCSEDTLIVYKLDRLASNVKHLIDISKKLEEIGVNLVSICDSIDTTTPDGKVMFKMIGVIAEVERTKTDLETDRGKIEVNPEDFPSALELYDWGWSMEFITEATGVSEEELNRMLKELSEKG
ncbi:recombinase family protein [Neobacillus sp. NRS-1170]|uniref:recombinase family protein n=1 Tax=Neobacillus sp. NRS-1170 TaxID=3233898 RepID=UPI003D2A798C